MIRRLPLEEAVERAYWAANLEGPDSDVYNHMLRYAAIRALSETEQARIYKSICEGLGF